MLWLELGAVLVLILVNGFLAMSELAVVSSRRARLQALEASGLKGAKAARELTENPGRFLSSVQIGITLVGVMAGAFGGATIAERLSAWLAGTGMGRELADTLGFGAVVLAISYLSLILGELVPKQVALGDPERIASRVAAPMRTIAFIARPAVWFLDVSAKVVLRLVGRAGPRDRGVSEEEIHALIAEAESAGVVEPEEKQMMARVLRLGDLSVRAVMTPRPDLDWIDLGRPPEEQLKRFLASTHSLLPIARGAVDEAAKVIHVKDVAKALAAGGPVDIEALGRDAAILHDGSDLLSALDALRKAGVDMAFVVDEYGTLEGIVTSADVLGAIAGEAGSIEHDFEPDAIQRADGSWLLDGGSPVEDVADLLQLVLPEPRDYHTLGGFVLDRLRRMPRSGDAFDYEGWRFEVVDMDGRRIDKVLARLADVPADSLAA
jgi:putative hemolysin